jgi:hypothetical protein
MNCRFRFAIWLAAVLAFAFTIPVFAGGWAVITLDSLPRNVVAGEEFTVSFMVRQHGRTPMTGLDPTITAMLTAMPYKEDQFVVHAEPDGKPGHYSATLTFPKDGEWRWSIQAFSMDQLMPTLNVSASVAGAKNDMAGKTERVNFFPILWVVRALALGLGVIALIIASRRQSRAAIAFTAFCLFVGLGSFVTGAGAGSEVEAQTGLSSQASLDQSVPQVELGRQLFVAKGCITCHVNRKILNSSEYWTIDMGATDLSNFSANEDVLFMRLKDPTSVKSDTKMPNLELPEEEIEALVAFINSK